MFVNDRDMAGKDDPLMTFDYAADAASPARIPVVHAKRAVIDQMLADGRQVAAGRRGRDRQGR